MTNAMHFTPGQMGTEEFVTIIGPSMVEVMRQFKARGLDQMGFAIAGRVGRHQFAFSEDGTATDLFGGERMLAATFSRTATPTSAA